MLGVVVNTVSTSLRLAGYLHLPLCSSQRHRGRQYTPPQGIWSPDAVLDHHCYEMMEEEG